MAGIFADMPWEDGKINPSGIAVDLYYIPKSFIKTHPKVKAAPATAAENVTLDGDYELVAGKTWLKLHSIHGKGKVSFEPIGEDECGMFMNKGSFKYPDLDVAAKNLAKGTINASVIFIAKMPHQSEFRFVVLGNADYASKVKVSGDSGDAPGSAKGLTIEVEVADFNPLPGYAGDIVLSDGTLDCATGVFTPTGG